ncbi:hypothetical protein BUN20_10855 [Bacteroides fragilis]|uniref:DegT/DnrJ/EryC1/StrS aminotransferase family protein n=1 Tax=Bacteroides fragilis 3_1_12 TaxID=457424 RepID=A0ABN0BN76_BACFG|nr:hypothetical protein BUN20_10855 [Bacteroides fragilis]EFR54332.1 hypothetical protein BFAG_03030 [Bacteroides fragilis 3_1_12]
MLSVGEQNPLSPRGGTAVTDAPFYGNGTSERLFDIGLCLPSGPTLTDEDIRRVVDTIRKM